MKCLCLKSKECDVFTENGDYIGTKMFMTGDIYNYYGSDYNNGYVIGDNDSYLKFCVKSSDGEIFKIIDSDKHCKIKLCFSEDNANAFLQTISSDKIRDIKLDSKEIMIIYEE